MADPLRENTRIDKGVKRPRYQHKPVSPKADLGTWKIPDDLDVDEVLAEYLAASTTSSIAARYGLSRKALVGWLREKRPDQWKRVQVLRALVQKEDSEEGLENANDALSLARARELLRASQFSLERLDSQTWGQRVEQVIEVNHNLLVDQSLVEDARELMKSIRGESHKIIDLQPDAVQQEDKSIT